jgi:alcohol-forming fatty acyl-CoA reductase
MAMVVGETILLTGATGFLGKVVLEELFRCRSELPFERVILPIRPTSSRSAQERFLKEVASSLCFSRLEKTWTNDVNVIECDLARPDCGIEPEKYCELLATVTRIIHCAGSVAFESCAEETLLDNVTSGLNLLEIARRSISLRRMVSTSTAYVTPHTINPINEVFTPLPESAAILYHKLRTESCNKEEILRATGHPNLYTLAKCLAEHLLAERKEDVPLTIVRPAVISVSWRYPFQGWVDSFAAFTGLVAGVGVGILRVLNSDPRTAVDIVPVDVVAQTLIQEAFLVPQDLSSVRIVHAVSTVNHGINVTRARAAVVEYFTRNSVVRRPKVVHIGLKETIRFRFYEAIYHRLPLAMATVSAKVRGDAKRLKAVRKAKKMQFTANTLFDHFGRHTYNFQSKGCILAPDFDSDEYLQIICHGVRHYLLQRDPTEVAVHNDRKKMHRSNREGEKV